MFWSQSPKLNDNIQTRLDKHLMTNLKYVIPIVTTLKTSMVHFNFISISADFGIVWNLSTSNASFWEWSMCKLVVPTKSQMTRCIQVCIWMNDKMPHDIYTRYFHWLVWGFFLSCWTQKFHAKRLAPNLLHQFWYVMVACAIVSLTLWGGVC